MKIKASKSQIETFITQPAIGLVGVSRNPKKFGYGVFNDMKKNGYKVYPVNSNTDTIDDEKCYRSIDELPQDTGSVVLMSQKKDTMGLINQAVARGIKNIWVQQGCESPETTAFASEGKASVIQGYCIHMFANPGGVHSFHRFFVKLFGGMPK